MAGQNERIELKYGNIVFYAWECNHKTTRAGKIFKYSYRDPATGKRLLDSAKSLEKLKVKAEARAGLLAQGSSEASRVTALDIDELISARRALRGHHVRVSVAAEEWAWARAQVGSDFREAIERWRDSRPVAKRIKFAAAIDAFISARQRGNNDPERTYRSKLTSLLARLGDIYVDEIDYQRALAAVTSWHDGVTQNDMTKRLGTLLRWCRKAGYLPSDRVIVTDLVERAEEERTEIGIIDATTLAKVLKLIRDERPEYLAGAVLAAFCGMRNDEIHGKRARKGETRATMSRQRWSDIHAEGRRPYVLVSVAKKRTPADRHAIIPPAAVEWLKLCDHSDEYVIPAGGMERVRAHAAAAGIKLPENCFRHTAISAGLVHLFKSDKARAAENYGTSVQMIDRHYRKPLSPAAAKAWFSGRPA